MNRIITVDAIRFMGLEQLLLAADDNDIGLLSDYITNNGEGRMSLSNEVCDRLVDCRIASRFENEDRKLVADEICRFGGNTLVNLFRGKGVEYIEAVRNVADHFKVNLKSNIEIVDLEQAILASLMDTSLKKMSATERAKFLADNHLEDFAELVGEGWDTREALSKLKAGSYFWLSAAFATVFAESVLSQGMAVFGTEFVAARLAGAALGPIAWVSLGVWSIADLASPAFRVTVPCVIQIAFIRQKLMLQLAENTT